MLPKAQFVILGAIMSMCSAQKQLIPDPPLMKISKDLIEEIDRKVCKALPIDKLAENDMLSQLTCDIAVRYTDVTGAAQSAKFLEQQCNCLSVKGPMWAHCRFTQEGEKLNAACYDGQLESSDVTCNYDEKVLMLNETILLAHKRPSFDFKYEVFNSGKLFETVLMHYNTTRRLLKMDLVITDLLNGVAGRINHGVIERHDAEGKVKGKEGLTAFMDGASCDGCNGALVTTICSVSEDAASKCKPNELWVTFSKDFFEKTKDTEFRDEIVDKLNNLGQVVNAEGKEVKAMDVVKEYTSSALKDCSS